MFTTENLILRAYREEDLDRILDLWNEYPVQVATALDHVVPRTPKIKETFRGWVQSLFSLPPNALLLSCRLQIHVFVSSPTAGQRATAFCH